MNLARLSWSVLLCTIVKSDSDLEPVVKIQDGSLRGTTRTSIRDGKTFNAFLGIPYAESPVGELRFKAPQPVRPWEGILDARDFGNECPQFSDEFHGDEDCLYINVFTNKIPGPSDDLKPVIVWVHYSGYVVNSGANAAPDYFVQEDIVFVSFNFRLGVLGLLSLQTEEVPGNAGMKDQVLALKWVQRNIATFGGDPSRVTVFGESSGATQVHLLLLSPLTQGLFHQAILTSGTALRPWYVEYPSCNTEYIDNLGLNISDPQAAYSHLMNMTAEQLEAPLPNPILDPTIRVPVCPTIDLKSPPGQVFLPDTPFNLINSGRFHKMPIISGMNNAEGIKYAPALETIINEPIEEYLETVIPPDLKIDGNSPEGKQLLDTIKHFYFPNGTQNNKLLTYIRYVTDVIFFNPLYCMMKLQSNHFNMPQFAYEFSVDGRYHIYQSDRHGLPGASHGDHLPYLLAVNRTTDFQAGSIELIISERLVKMWANFVKTGDPTPEQDPLLQNLTWTPFNALDFPYAQINVNLALGHHLRNQSYNFWRSLYNYYNFSSSCWS